MEVLSEGLYQIQSLLCGEYVDVIDGSLSVQCSEGDAIVANLRRKHPLGPEMLGNLELLIVKQFSFTLVSVIVGRLPS